MPRPTRPASLLVFLPLLALGCGGPPPAVAQAAPATPDPVPGFTSISLALEPLQGSTAFDAFRASVSFTGGGGSGRVLGGTWYEFRGSRDGGNRLSEKARPVTYAGNLHRPWDYDQAGESRYGLRREPSSLETGRVLHDRPGGLTLEPGQEAGRDLVLHAPAGTFDRVEFEVFGWSWDPGAPIVLCWKTDEERLTGFVEPWVHTGGQLALQALDLDVDGAQRRVELCREAQRGEGAELEPLSSATHAALIRDFQPELLRRRAESAPVPR